MKEYTVTFTQYYVYYVDAESEEDAIKQAEREFDRDMRSPIANTMYDDVEAQCEDDDEDE